MGSRTKKPFSRCLACHMRKELCICAEIKECRSAITNATQLLIFMHHRERHLTTNTGRLASLAIPNCTIHYRGLPVTPLKCEELISSENETWVLFPHDDATVLSEELFKNLKKPLTLIVPDGSWRQASKVAKREPALASAKRVILPPGPISKYRLRREPKAEGLATFEAIARVLGLSEGREVQQKLESLFDLMVERTLGSRGYVNPATR